MATYQIPRDLLLAVAQASAKDDIRYYLNGVALEFRTGTTYMVGTDGHIMLVGCHRVVEQEAMAGEIILPLDSVLAACKAKQAMLELQFDDTTRQFTLGNVIGKTMDGKYPDWRRVVPAFTDDSTVRVQLNLALGKPFLAAAKALGMKPHLVQLWPGKETKDGVYVQFVGHECDLFGIWMPLRPSEFVKPDWI
jgi:DNA polymerase III subunit beta